MIQELVNGLFKDYLFAGYLFGSFATGWCVAFLVTAFKKLGEKI